MQTLNNKQPRCAFPPLCHGRAGAGADLLGGAPLVEHLDTGRAHWWGLPPLSTIWVKRGQRAGSEARGYDTEHAETASAEPGSS